MTPRSTLRSFGPLVFLCAALAACGSTSTTTTTVAPEIAVQESTENQIVASDQQSDGDTLTISQIDIEEGSAYAVAYRSTNGAPGERLGYSELLGSGSHRDVNITLDNALLVTTEVFLMLHREGSGNTILNYPGPDSPVQEDGRVLAAIVEIEISAE